ncbi:MAG: thiamine phosphate synthase [Thiobacillaceae bacterium]
MVEPVRLSGLYAITPDWADTKRLLAVTDAILDAGCRWLQYRNKTASPELRQAQARALRTLTRRHGAHLIVNDDPELARSVDADGVHLGREDAHVSAARDILGNERLIGVSCYQSLALARRAVAAGADYVAFGSVYPSTTKPQATRADLALFGEARQRLPVPVVAIGGITPDNAAAVIAAGADALAVITALYEAEYPGAQAERFLALFDPTAALRGAVTTADTQ